MKFCAKCGKRADATTCPYCGYHVDKTFISFKIRHSKKKFVFIASVIIGIIITSSVISWSIFDPHGPLYDRGDFQLYYVPVQNPDYRDIENIFYNSGFFDGVIDSFNKSYKLPYDVFVLLSECPPDIGANAYYDPITKQIILCYQLIEQFGNQLYPYAQSNQELHTFVQDAIYETFLHEVGHAFIDIYDLPLIGKEEDAADQLATIVLLQGGDEGADALFAVATTWLEASKQTSDMSQLPMWDVHSLDQQRFYNILCFVYGKDPLRYASLVNDGYLPEERAVYCESEYDKISKSWYALLSPYLKET